MNLSIFTNIVRRSGALNRKSCFSLKIPSPPPSSSFYSFIRRPPSCFSSFMMSYYFSTSSIQFWKSSKPKNKHLAYKLKTHQGASKRFFVTGKGQFKRSQAGKQHLMTGLSRSNKRRLKPMVIVHKSYTSRLRKLLPYAGKRAGFRRVSEQDSVWWNLGRLQKSGLALKMAIKRAKQSVNKELATTGGDNTIVRVQE